MTELSKTAKASMVKETKKTSAETPEESIRKLRLDLGAGLYIPAHRIQALLNAYDALLEMPRSVLKAAALGAAYDLSSRRPIPGE